uniref:VM domain-containing protein n=1 Tax=Glossina pallidipes TaxID=7398 RepID=A0A1B0AAJ7_GLOPL
MQNFFTQMFTCKMKLIVVSIILLRLYRVLAFQAHENYPSNSGVKGHSPTADPHYNLPPNYENHYPAPGNPGQVQGHYPNPWLQPSPGKQHFNPTNDYQNLGSFEFDYPIIGPYIPSDYDQGQPINYPQSWQHEQPPCNPNSQPCGSPSIQPPPGYNPPNYIINYPVHGPPPGQRPCCDYNSGQIPFNPSNPHNFNNNYMFQPPMNGQNFHQQPPGPPGPNVGQVSLIPPLPKHYKPHNPDGGQQKLNLH